MKKTALVILAEGCEEIEAITPIDVLRRAGIRVKAVGVGTKRIKGSRGIVIETDMKLESVKTLPDVIILPGGMPGAKHLRESKAVAKLIRRMHEKKKWIGAICAAPALVLTPTGVLDGKQATCYPGYERNFTPAVQFSRDCVVTSEQVITSRGPGTALAFSLEIVRQLVGEKPASELKGVMLAGPKHGRYGS